MLRLLCLTIFFSVVSHIEIIVIIWLLENNWLVYAWGGSKEGRRGSCTSLYSCPVKVHKVFPWVIDWWVRDFHSGFSKGMNQITGYVLPVIFGSSPPLPLLLAKASLSSDLSLKITSCEKSQTHPTGLITTRHIMGGFPGSSDGKASAYKAGDLGSIPGSGRSPGEGNGNTLQYSCLENPTDQGAWWATVHGVAKSRTRLSDFTSLHFRHIMTPPHLSSPDTLCMWKGTKGCERTSFQRL